MDEYKKELNAGASPGCGYRFIITCLLLLEQAFDKQTTIP
jgi:hypothetical protein